MYHLRRKLLWWLVSIGVALAAMPPPDHVAASCVERASSGALDEVFAADFDGMLGADYQRTIPLPDGRVLWFLQDAFLRTSGGPSLVHNVGLVQDGGCFNLLRTGSDEQPKPWIAPDLTIRHHRWVLAARRRHRG